MEGNNGFLGVQNDISYRGDYLSGFSFWSLVYTDFFKCFIYLQSCTHVDLCFWFRLLLKWLPLALVCQRMHSLH